MSTTALVFGALSAAGRNIVEQLSQNSEVCYIRAVDYGLKELAFLSKRFEKAFEKVDYIQANYSRPVDAEKAFIQKNNKQFDWVFNCSFEVKPGQVEEVYKYRIYQASLTLAELAVKYNVRAFIHLTSALEYVYTGNRSKEDDEMQPWAGSFKSIYTVKSCREIQSIENLPLVILRIPSTYGPGDFTLLASGLCLVYTAHAAEIPFPKIFPTNIYRSCVHILDVARAAVLCAHWRSSSTPSTKAEIFNLANPVDTNVQMYFSSLDGVYEGHDAFKELIMEALAPEEIDESRDYLNDVFMDEWTAILRDQDVKPSSLTPYLEKDDLDNHFWSIDGSKIERELGFTYIHQELKSAAFREQVEDFISMGIWPKKDLLRN